ncbi:hypothetical protein TNCV_4051521 [Trichonephila clavipes]|nr:hypothetical protein TNCV_4051521 [Trichonephila clavipes]
MVIFTDSLTGEVYKFKRVGYQFVCRSRHLILVPIMCSIANSCVASKNNIDEQSIKLSRIDKKTICSRMVASLWPMMLQSSHLLHVKYLSKSPRERGEEVRREGPWLKCRSRHLTALKIMKKALR